MEQLVEFDSVSRNRDRSVNQAFGRELRVIEHLARADEAVGVVELAERLRLPASTAHRMLTTLRREGYVRQDEHKKYELGSKILALAGDFLGRWGLRKTSLPVLRGLKDRTGETSYLVVKDGREGVCVECVESPDHMRVSLSVGGRCELYYSAVGKIFLAEFTDAELADYARKTRFQRFTRRTLVSLPALKRETQRVRRQGWGADDEEHYVGIRCVAAPVRDFRGRTVAALAVGGPSTRLRRSGLEPLGRTVREAAVRLSHAMGHAKR